MRVGDTSSELLLADNSELAGSGIGAGVNYEQIDILRTCFTPIVYDEGGTKTIDHHVELHSQP